MARTENTASSSSSVIAFVFVSLGKCLLIRCLATVVSSGSTIPTLMLWGKTQAHRQQGDLISLLSFFENKGSRLKKTHVTKGALSTLDEHSNSVLLMLLHIRLIGGETTKALSRNRGSLITGTH
jgi:hypothetical protein